MRTPVFFHSGSEDSRGYVWDRHYNARVASLPHDAVVNCVAVNPRDPSMAVSVSDDHTVKIWRSKAFHRWGPRVVVGGGGRRDVTPPGFYFWKLIFCHRHFSRRMFSLSFGVGKHCCCTPLEVRLATPWKNPLLRLRKKMISTPRKRGVGFRFLFGQKQLFALVRARYRSALASTRAWHRSAFTNTY